MQQANFANQNHELPVSTTAVVSGTINLTSDVTSRYDLGVPTSSTDPNGNVTTVPTTAYDGVGGYDGFGRLHQVTRPDGSASVWNYALCVATGPYCPPVLLMKSPRCSWSSGTPAITIVTGYIAYDVRGRVIEQGTVLLGGVISRVDTSYDQMGNVVQVTRPYTGSSPAYSTTYHYDLARDRLTETDAPQNASDTCSPCQNVTTLAYSGFTMTSAHTVGDSVSSSSTHNTQTVRDALGETLETVDSNSGTTFYNYDAFGDLAATQDADGKHTFISYDGLGHKTGIVDPNMGTLSYISDALGEITCQTDAKGQSIIMTYDGIGRLATKRETSAGAGCSDTSGPLSAWTYDSATHGLGLPASMVGADGFERDYAYDTLSRPSDVITTPGAGATAYTMSTGYDSFGRVSTITYPVSVTPASGGTTPTAVASITSGPVNTGTVVTLDGSTSTDPNGLGLQYQWTQTAGPALAVGAFDSAAETTSFTPSLGGNYSFELQVIDSGSALSTPATVSITVKPLAPSGAPTLSVNPSVDGNVTVSWSAVSGVDSYILYQSPDNISYTSVQSGLTGTSTSVTGLTNGTYYYKLASVAGGVTGNQGSASTALTVTLPPGAPTGMTVTPADQTPSTNYTASWTAPASGTVTTYQLLEDNNSGFSSPTTYTITAPTHSKVRSESSTGTYYYKARACNGTACGSYSGVDNVVVMNLPLAPTLSASPSTISSGGSSTLTWAKHSGDTVSSYTLESTLGVTIYSGSATSDTVSPTFTKSYKVEACNAAGCGPWSTTVTVTVSEGGGSLFSPPHSLDPEATPELDAEAPDATRDMDHADVARSLPELADAMPQP